jgi:hypothetical protein
MPEEFSGSGREDSVSGESLRLVEAGTNQLTWCASVSQPGGSAAAKLRAQDRGSSRAVLWNRDLRPEIWPPIPYDGCARQALPARLVEDLLAYILGERRPQLVEPPTIEGSSRRLKRLLRGF